MEVNSMIEFIRTVVAIHGDRRAVTALEYALVAGAIALVVSLAFAGVGSQIATKMKNAIGT